MTPEHPAHPAPTPLRRVPLQRDASSSPHHPLLALLSLALLTGCWQAPERVPLPLYTPATARQTLEFMAERDAQLETLQAQCKIVLRNEDGDKQSLDGAIVIRGDTDVRLRGTKLNQVLFDLTVTGPDVSLYADDRVKEKIESKDLDGRRIADGLSLFIRGVDLDAVQDVQRLRDGDLRVVYDGGRVTATVDTTRRVVSGYRILDENGQPTRNIDLTWTLVDDTLVPVVWLAQGVDGTSVRVELFNVEVNEDLNPLAFRPHPRALKF